MSSNAALVFGPIPSRRLGRSLGVNNVPMKTCSYSCVYCQLGATEHTQLERQTFYAPGAIAPAVRARVEALRARGEGIDYVSFVPDGEPTLDVGLGKAIVLLRPLGIPVAVMTNASLLWRPAVRDELQNADWVSLKLDAVREDVWRGHNRPHPSLELATVLDGIRRFAARFEGILVTETMLVRGSNDAEDVLTETADFVASLSPRTAYLGLPTRPPGEPWVQAPEQRVVERALVIFGSRLDHVELLSGYAEPDVAHAGDVGAELAAITAVHPLRDVEVDALLSKAHASREMLDELLRRGVLREVWHNRQRFYVRGAGAR